MDTLSEVVRGLSPTALILLGCLALAQLALQVYALIDLFRRPTVTGGRRWVWLLVILLGNLLGAIIYLAVGRSGPPELTDDRGGSADARERALDRLYGDRDR